MKYRLIEKDAFQVVGIKREFSLVNGDNLVGIPKLWDEVNGNGTCDLLFKLNNGNLKGVLGVCSVICGSQNIDYWVATEYHGEVPEGLNFLAIPASKWAVFEVHGPMPDAMQNAWKQIFTEWFPASGYEHAGTPELEVYPEENPYNQDSYTEIWIPVK